MARPAAIRVGTPYTDSRAASPHSPHTPHSVAMTPASVRAQPGFQRQLRHSWLHPDAKAAPVAHTMKEFRAGQSSARQEELRSDLVFVALQHEPGSRSNEHIATIQRHLCSAPDVVFAASMPQQVLRRLCAGAEMGMVEHGEPLFAAGEPAAKLHVILSGQAKLSRKVPSGEVRPVGTLGIGRAVDYEDFVGSHGARRTSCHADGTVMVLKLDKGLYEQAMLEHADEEMSQRMATVAASELFAGVSHKLRLHIAELLRTVTFRHGTRIAVRGSAADRLWFLRAGGCKVVTTLKSPAQLHDVKIQGWGSKTTVREVDVIRLQAGDVLGEESVANTKFKPSPSLHAAVSLPAGDAADATHEGGGGGGPGGDDGEGAASAPASAAGAAPGALSEQQAAEAEDEKKYRATAVKYSHTVVAEGEVTAYELTAGDLWKVMKGASDGMRAAFETTHGAALARRESLHSAQVAEICAVQPAVWTKQKPRPASASSLLVRSNEGRGRAGGPGAGPGHAAATTTTQAAAKPRPATAVPSRMQARVSSGEAVVAVGVGGGGGAAAVDDARTSRGGQSAAVAGNITQGQPLTSAGTAAAATAQQRQQRPASATPQIGGGSDNLARGAKKPQQRPSTARASFMRGAIWDYALGGSNRQSVDLSDTAMGGAVSGLGGRRPASASDGRTLEEFMRPPPATDKKKRKKKKKKQQHGGGGGGGYGSAGAAAARKAERVPRASQGQRQKNPFVGRRTEWPYVDTLKSRREETAKSNNASGAKSTEAMQSVAFWPHCRFDKKTFVLDMPKPSVSNKA